VVYNKFGSFVTLEATIYACLGVVWLVDILLRKYNINLKEVYDSSSKGAYYYWKGFNFLPWIAILGGMAFSLAIYNPLTMAVHLPGVFVVAGAALPSGILSGLIYYALAKTITVPRRKGFPEIPQPSRILTREEMEKLR
jgi:cytosine/uracil/thiamine/allantoin permease